MISRVETTTDRATSQPPIVTVGAQIRRQVTEAQRAGLRVGVVPTMGALHDGHLSLVNVARDECDVVVATVFVNPTQFGPGEDFDNYPRNLDRDATLLAARGCDYLFAPHDAEIYPDGYETTVDVGDVARPFEGAHRPVHFAGVATVVLKLLNLVPAHVAYFGQKDYQQTLVIKRMVADLNVPTEVMVCPTIREPDGLAMSSRNAYLSEGERRQAAGVHASLQLAKHKVGEGERNTAALSQVMCKHLDELGGIELDYIAFVRSGTVEEVETVDGATVALIAARVGNTRLIDNLEII
ncbi:MAG: pantoate--beta-alanine ligase [Aeoliella sp.]